MTRWIRRLINLFRRERLERELDAELQTHLRMDTHLFMNGQRSEIRENGWIEIED